MKPSTFTEQDLEPAALDLALRECGGFFMQLPRVAELLDRMLCATKWFFTLPRDEKAALSIERSPHFRGWSEMRNERDWREQLHLGRDRLGGGAYPVFRRLEGPNLWPLDPGWRRTVDNYLDVISMLGEVVLTRLAEALGFDPAAFVGVGRDGYLVMKLIGYHPQTSFAATRPGVAPHVDFSWLTLTLQDGAGLEVLVPGGRWMPIEPRRGNVWVHVGELLQFATHGRYQATPHRVINASIDRTRISIPLFVNPPLAAEVPLLAGPPPPLAVPASTTDKHVHRVLPPGEPAAPFHFGEAEWQRKGLGRWCAACAPT